MRNAISMGFYGLFLQFEALLAEDTTVARRILMLGVD